MSKSIKTNTNKNKAGAIILVSDNETQANTKWAKEGPFITLNGIIHRATNNTAAIFRKKKLQEY